MVDGLSVSAEICHGRREKEDNLTRECLLRRIIHINLAFFGGDYGGDYVYSNDIMGTKNFPDKNNKNKHCAE